jgi:hypothetical protein
VVQRMVTHESDARGPACDDDFTRLKPGVSERAEGYGGRGVAALDAAAGTATVAAPPRMISFSRIAATFKPIAGAFILLHRTYRWIHGWA